MIVRYAVAGGGEHFLTVLQNRLLLRAGTNTVVISVMTTAVALVIAYVLAAGLWRANPGLRRVLLAFCCCRS